MKSLLLIFSVIISLIPDTNAMISKKDQFSDAKESIFFSAYGHAKPKKIPVKIFKMQNPTFEVKLIPNPDWAQVIVKNKFFGKSFKLQKGKAYGNTKIYAPLNIRYDMQPNRVIDALWASFHPDELRWYESYITILE